MFYFEEPTFRRKQQAIEYINEFLKYNSKINGVGKLKRYLDDYEGWLEYLKIEENIVPNEDSVPTKTYFFIKEDTDMIVGMVNIRLALNEKAKKYGHIGYSIRPTMRNKGYNKLNLYLALLECKKFKIEEALMVCEKNNVASRRTIERLGGKLIEETDTELRYIIYVADSIDKHKALLNYCKNT